MLTWIKNGAGVRKARVEKASVRKGGAAGCGLAPVRPTAWQRAQFLVSNNSPRPAGVVASCARTGAVTLMVIIMTR